MGERYNLVLPIGNLIHPVLHHTGISVANTSIPSTQPKLFQLLNLFQNNNTEKAGIHCSPNHYAPGRSSWIFSRAPAVDQDINVLLSFRFSKYFVSSTSFSDVLFPFSWLSMLSSHLVLGLPIGLCQQSALTLSLSL